MDLTISPISYRNTTVVKRNNSEKQPQEVSFRGAKINYNTVKTLASAATFAFLTLIAAANIIKYAFGGIKDRVATNKAQTEIVVEPKQADSIPAKTLQE